MKKGNRNLGYLSLTLILFQNNFLMASEVKMAKELEKVSLIGSSHFINVSEMDGEGEKEKKERSKRNLNISGLDGDESFLVIGTDEGDNIQVLKRTGVNEFQADRLRDITLKSWSRDELDIEGIALTNKTVFVLGSHSRIRKRIDLKKNAGDNIKLLKTTHIEPSREGIYRLEMDSRGNLLPKSMKMVSLRNLFRNDPFF